MGDRPIWKRQHSFGHRAVWLKKLQSVPERAVPVGDARGGAGCGELCSGPTPRRAA
jgi:hypothetical protein